MEQNPAQLAIQQQAPSVTTPLSQTVQQITQQQSPDPATEERQSAIAQAAKAMAILKPNAKGSDETSTMSQIGQANQTPSYAGYCLQYVDDQTGNTNRQPTAYADYQANQQSGNIKTSGTPPKGARVYFAPNSTNGNMGHVGISDGNGEFTSATDNGVKTFNIQDWDKYAGQQFIGWAPPNSK